jgi:hypothetical protein
MIESIIKIIAGAAGGIGGKVAEAAFPAFHEEADDHSRSIEGQAVEVIKQVGTSTDDPEEITTVLDGFSMEYGEHGRQKQFKQADEKQTKDPQNSP